MPPERNSYLGAAHCFPSHSAHFYKGNILKFDNYWGGGASTPGSDGPGKTALVLRGSRQILIFLRLLNTNEVTHNEIQVQQASNTFQLPHPFACSSLQ